MANKKVNIDITTTSNTSGADKAAASLDKIAETKRKNDIEEEKLAKREIDRAKRRENEEKYAEGVAERAAERRIRKAEEAAEKKERALKRETDALKKAEQAAKDAATATENSNRKAISSAEALATKTEQLASKESTNEARLAQLAADKAKRQTASKMQQAGFQVADIATQVSGGTSLLQSFSQQAPQLLGAFGPQGAIAGAFVALGALGVKAFLDIGGQSQVAKENADQLASAISKIGEQAAKSVQEDWDFGTAAFNSSIGLAQALKDAVLAISAAQDEVRLKSTEAAQQQNSLLKQLYELQGRKPDELKDLKRQQEELLKIDQIKTQNALNDLARQKQVAEESVKVDQQKLTRAQEVKGQTEVALRFDEQEIASLRVKEQAIQRQIDKLKEAQTFFGSFESAFNKSDILGKINMLTSIPFAAGKAIFENVTAGKQEINKGYELGPLKARIDQLDSKITLYQNAVDEKVGTLTTAVTTAQDTLTQSTIAAGAKVEILAGQVNLTEIQGKLDEAKTQVDINQKMATEIATSIAEKIEGAKPVTEAQKTALESLGVILKDHQVLGSEVVGASNALSTLSSVLVQGINKNTSNTTELITTMNAYKATQDRLEGEIKNLRAMQLTPGRTGN